MALVTGTPVGNLETTQDIFLEGAVSVFIQDYAASEFYNPDAQGFYWMLSGTTSYPVYEIGCPANMSFSENLTVNDVLCDNSGVKGTIQQRNYLEFSFDFHSFLPLEVLRFLLKGGAVTEVGNVQKFGFGRVNNNQYFHLYAPKVYNEDTGDYIWVHFHRCQFVDPWTINMAFGTPWAGTGVKLRAFFDATKPAAQAFGMWGKSSAA